MQTIENATTYEVEIKKSKFICYIDTVHTVADVNIVIKNIKTKYVGATHYCYAYIIDNIKHFQDDGEPSGTAGIPILHVLESKNLQHIIAIVVRYFGGIKLGAGGLVRAYSGAVSKALISSKFVELKKCQRVYISFDYINTKKVDYIVKNYSILNKTFAHNITYELFVPIEAINLLIESLKSTIDFYKIDPNIIYKK